jgi:deoxyhypusine synthase
VSVAISRHATNQIDGSLSGAHVSEAVSWGKVKEKAKQANPLAEVTVVLSFVVSYVLNKSARRGGKPI